MTTLDSIAARLDAIEARLSLGNRHWLPADEAARRLGCPSVAALWRRIDRGSIPPQFVRYQLSPGGRRTGLRVDVEGWVGRR